MKKVTFFDVYGKRKYFISVKTIKKEPGRTQILGIFRTDPENVYCETNVRRYTAGDIYGGYKGQMI